VKDKKKAEDDRLIMKGFILDFSEWDDTIHITVLKFYQKFNVYPNILLASDKTYMKIDLYAQMHPERLLDPNGENIETGNTPYEGISYFTSDDYNLECCLDFELSEGNFTLIFDEAPDFDGEPVRVLEEKDNVYFFKRSA
jgi:hypothetical protein